MRPHLMRYPLLIILALSASAGLAQSKSAGDPFEIGGNLIDHSNYLKAADTVLHLKSRYYKTHKPGQPVIVDQAAALFLSYIGEEYPLNWKKSRVNQDDQALTFLPAVAYITQQAKNRQVVMINEDHNTPKHRLLTYNLLENFYKMGYRYLCAEALEDDSSCVNLGFPQIRSGFYMAEPNMGNLIKKAISLGFKVVPYESQDEAEEAEGSPYYTENLREVNQAKNIYKILLKDPGAKILVHAGHGHIWEHGGNVIFMGEYFKLISGIDPLTVNQSINSLNEFRNRLDASADLRNSAVPYVVLDHSQQPKVSKADQPGDYDLLVAWPSPKTTNGRKDYQLEKNGAERYMIRTSINDTGKLIQIRSVNAADDIPADQFIVKKGGMDYATSLEKGDYVIQLLDRNAKILWSRPCSIK